MTESIVSAIVEAHDRAYGLDGPTPSCRDLARIAQDVTGYEFQDLERTASDLWDWLMADNPEHDTAVAEWLVAQLRQEGCVL